jgi:RNA polymerase sigma-70 factor (ECF subfamily)
MAFDDIATQWTGVFNAQQTHGQDGQAARHALLVRYHDAVLQFLNRQINDPNDAGMIYSNFALRVLEVDAFLKRADPEKGRFRDYLKAVLRRMVVDYWREKNRRGQKEQALVEDSHAEPEFSEEEDELFLACWRQEIVNQAWRRLQEEEARAREPYVAVLQMVEKEPEIRSAKLADQLSKQLGRPVNAGGARKMLERGRQLFGKVLVAEVALSLQDQAGERVSPDRLEQELIELGLLLTPCKKALQGWGGEG